MPSSRRLIVDPDVACHDYCVSRCVRRSWLRGREVCSGREFAHHKAWAQAWRFDPAQAVDIGAARFQPAIPGQPLPFRRR